MPFAPSSVQICSCVVVEFLERNLFITGDGKSPVKEKARSLVSKTDPPPCDLTHRKGPTVPDQPYHFLFDFFS